MTSQAPAAVCLAADEAYVPGLKVTAASLLLHTKAEQHVEFFVLDTGISDRSWQEFEALVHRYSNRATTTRLKPDLSRFGECTRMRGSLACYSLLQVPQLIDREKVICLDVDMLVLADIAELWQRDMEDEFALAAFEPDMVLGDDCEWIPRDDPDRTLPYFNSGTMVLHLERWRAAALDSQVDVLIGENGSQLSTYDQTALNYVLRQKVGALETTWNSFDVGGRAATDYLNDQGLIVHITHNKPWVHFKNLHGSLLWITFHDLILSGVPAVLRYGVLWRTRKWSNLRSALKVLAEGFLLQTPFTRTLLARGLAQRKPKSLKAIWLERWIKRRGERRSAN